MKFHQAMRLNPRLRAIFRSVLLDSAMAAAGLSSVKRPSLPVVLASPFAARCWDADA